MFNFKEGSGEDLNDCQRKLMFGKCILITSIQTRIRPGLAKCCTAGKDNVEKKVGIHKASLEAKSMSGYAFYSFHLRLPSHSNSLSFHIPPYLSLLSAIKL